MDRTYEKFLRLGISLAPLGIERREDNEPYCCTPKGADILGWAGIDGIHFCRVRGFGSRIFAVSPMNSAPDHIHLIAEDFEHLLRLLLACGDAAALEQAWQWDAAQFDAFLTENPPEAAQQAVLEAIRTETGLTPLAEPWAYLHGLDRSFDYGRLRYSEDFAPAEPPAPRSDDAWSVYFDGNFWGHSGRGRAGKEISLGAQFSWAERQWLIPAAYVCAKGLVLDLCMCVEAEALRAFAEKWGLTEDNDDAERFSEDEQRQLALENPLSMHIMPCVTVNGRTLSRSRGCACAYRPGGHACEAEMEAVMAHYGLDREAGWFVTRCAFPWNGRKPAELRSLTLTLRAEPTAIPGPRFTVHAPGDTAELPLPGGGTCTLTVLSLEPQTLPDRAGFPVRYFFPQHFMLMEYTLTPEPEDRVTLTDCARSDQPLEIMPDGAPTAGGCFGIIGGEDGPTAIVFPGKETDARHAACSALHFEPPVDGITWRAVIHKTLYSDLTCTLL